MKAIRDIQPDLPVKFPQNLHGHGLGHVVAQGKQSTLVSGYPEYDGTEVNVRITAVHEWSAGVEASIEGEVQDDLARPISFFDTRYVARKGKYKVGETYAFRLCAFGYRAEIVPEADREFRMEGEDAVKRRRDLGEEQKYDENGCPEPLIFRMDSMVAFIPLSAAYPDDAEFQSPVFGEVQEIEAFDESFLRMEIAISRGDKDVVIPLLVRKSLMDGVPRKNDPIRGTLWLQGYCID